MKKLQYKIQDNNLSFEIKDTIINKEPTNNKEIIDTGKLIGDIVGETLLHPLFSNKFKNDRELLKHIKEVIIDTVNNTGRCSACGVITSRKKHGTDTYVCIDCSH